MVGRIEDYGLIGDLQTVALVSRHGSVDWLCVPRFDSGAIFASLLGDEDNGHWTIQPEGRFRSPRRRYRGDTLASALLANDLHFVGRSFKYHRPRGILGSGAEEPNALVQRRWHKGKRHLHRHNRLCLRRHWEL